MTPDIYFLRPDYHSVMSGKREDLLRLLAAASVTAGELVEELETDFAFRAQAVEMSKRLTGMLQTPIDRAWELFLQSVYPAVLQTTLDAGWLRLITNAGEAGASADQLALSTSSDPGLVRRMMRVLTSAGTIRESGTDIYAPTPFSSLLCTPEWEAGLRHAGHDYVMVMAQMAGYFAKTGYQLASTDEGGIYQHAHGFRFLDHLKTDAKAAKEFNTFMSVVRSGKKAWFDAYPVADKLRVVESASDVLLVDMGGGKGHDLAAFASVAKKFGLQGRLVLQDLPPVIAQVPPHLHSAIEPQPHNFFTPQPVLYARAYYLRNVLHGWEDQDCMQILSLLRHAMKAGYSKLLINDIVLPDRGCAPRDAAFDIMMMGIVGGRERTKSEWERMIASVEGLKLENIWEVDGGGESLLEVVKIE